MDAVLLTWRWQNILSIWIIVIALALLTTFGAQIFRKASGAGNNA